MDFLPLTLSLVGFQSDRNLGDLFNDREIGGFD